MFRFHTTINNRRRDCAAFAEDENLPYIPNGSGNSPEAAESIPDWVIEVADDMDVYVAQRDFEEAVSLAEKTRAFWDGASPSAVNLHRDLRYDSSENSIVFLL